MRLLSIGQWHHYAYMAISMALLGFGAAGSLLFLLFRRIETDPEAWLVGLAGATAVSFSLAFSLSQGVALDPLQLVWQPTQWLAMLGTYLLMAVPFLFSGGIIGIILKTLQIHRVSSVRQKIQIDDLGFSVLPFSQYEVTSNEARTTCNYVSFHFRSP